MSFAAKYDKNIVSGYSAGFGAAGIFSSGAYLLLTFFFTTKITLLIMLVVPVVMLLDYWLVLTDPIRGNIDDENGSDSMPSVETDLSTRRVSYREKFSQLPPLIFTVMLPIFVTTLFMCFMNQGLFELVYVDTISLSRDVQYRLYNALCQLGIFFGQSSAQLFQIKHLWVLMLIEGLLLLFFLAEVLNPFHMIVPVVLAAVLEGMIGGCMFSNTFYRISEEEKSEALTDFNMEIAMICNEAGAAAAGFLAIPSHKYLCATIST